MSKEIRAFGKIKKLKLGHQKNLILLKDVDIDSMQISIMVWLKIMMCWKNVIIFRIRSVIVLKKNLTAVSSILKTFESQNRVLRWQGYGFS